MSKKTLCFDDAFTIKLILLSCVLLFQLHAYYCAPQSLTIARVERIHVLAGQSPPPSTVISCVIYSGVSASTIKWHHNDQDLIIDQKYQLLSNTRLRINRITAADEGTYQCSYMYAGARVYIDLVSITVQGAAGFASEAAITKDAFQGDSVDVDTRIVYTGAGPGNINQTITLLQIFKQDSTNGMKMIYFCSNEGSRADYPCPSNDKVTATKGSHKFDLMLTFKNLTMEDGGEYLIRIEVLNPGVSSRSYITKNLVIRMYGLKVKQGNGSLVCEATGGPLFSLVWTDARGQSLSSDPNFRFTSAILGDKVSLTAMFDKFTTEMEGWYFCTASVSVEGTAGINKTIGTLLSGRGNSSEEHELGIFQLAIGPVSAAECSLWYDREASSKMETTIRDGIIIKVAEHCNCTVLPSDFSVGQLHCAGEWLYVRSSVQDDMRIEVILTAIDNWINGATPTITMGVFSLEVNRSCSNTGKSLSSNCLD